MIGKLCTYVRWSIAVMLVAAIFIGFSSCGNGSRDAMCQLVDSLNMKSYRMYYVALDSAKYYADLAYDNSEDYADGKAEAMLHQAFVQYMRMDYDKASELYLKAYDLTGNYLLKAIADIGMIKVCQNNGQNKDLYDYKNDAEARLKRIDEDATKLTDRQKILLNYAKSEYYLSLSIYYNYILQESKGREQLQVVSRNKQWFDRDTAQFARFCTLTGEYERALTMSTKTGLKYLQASSLQRMAANALLHEQAADSLRDNGMLLSLAQQALQLYRDYGSLYSTALTYLTISDYYVINKEYTTALDTATKALEFINMQHKRLYPDDEEFLMPFDINPDTISTEMRWMKQGRTNCSWNWISTVREKLSIIYSCMNLKPQSDYNRNIYLDILEATRQDKAMEQRLETLQREEKTQNILIIAIAVFAILVMAAIFLFIKHLKRRSKDKYNEDLKRADQMYKDWMKGNEAIYSSMSEEEKRIESETYIHEQHIAENKQSYIDKCTSLSMVYSITPFLDRALNELDKLNNVDEPLNIKKERIEYLNELFDKINSYNEILSHWIKVRQGSVKLNIENFELKPLFDTLSKNRNTFSGKNIKLNIGDVDCVVKADRALTLFMMNTLLDNARKYTPNGGQVSLDAHATDEYVEISVSDTGRGLSQDDINTIVNEKVYDSNTIGQATSDDDLKHNKGFGFGLMNCKGIIDKYKKTNAIFSVCTFNVESEIGKGSRFYFRLPKGVKKVLLILLTLLPLGLNAQEIDPAHEQWMQLAEYYTDKTYYANVDGLYNQALLYADSAIMCMNECYLLEYPEGNQLISLVGSVYTELDWWQQGVDIDYNILLVLRNEASVAALALRLWSVYEYNNEFYTRLYILTSHDYTVEQFCNATNKANITRQTVLAIFIVLAVIGLILFLILYYRINILPTFSMRQLMEFNKSLFAQHPRDLAEFVYNEVNNIVYVDGIAVGVTNDSGQLNIKTSKKCQLKEFMEDAVFRSVGENSNLSLNEGKLKTYLLVASNVNAESETTEQETVGAIAMLLHNTVSANDEKVLQMIAQQLATYIYYTDTKVESQLTGLHLKEDIKFRAEKEENNIHIQNMVLDNCLSTIKHETMYYPNRIKQILTDGVETENGINVDKIRDLNELTIYYKDVFTLLSSCAARQLENVMFKRKMVNVKELLKYAEKTMKRLNRKHDTDVECFTECNDDNMAVSGDIDMLHYLFDSLLAALMECEDDGEVRILAEYKDEFVKFSLMDLRQKRSNEELSQLFYPDNLVYDEDNDKLVGAQFMVARQIVREHDEYGGHRGCRINALPSADCFTIEFMLWAGDNKS